MRGMGAGPVLDSIRQPGRILAARGAGGQTSPSAFADPQTVLLLLEEFNVAQGATLARSDRALATVLFTDIVDSTKHAVRIGDEAWNRVLDRHDAIARSAVAARGGRLVKWTGDGMLATFDAPAHGLDCAKALRAALAHAGIAIRAGVHTGEVELRRGDVAGIGVNIAARVAGHALAGELLVSRTVRDLVAGAGYAFASRGRHDLKGVPGRWELLAVR
jgi:class 3 adenylate cyclase